MHSFRSELLKTLRFLALVAVIGEFGYGSSSCWVLVVHLGAPLFRLGGSCTQLHIIGEIICVLARVYKIWCSLYKVIV